MLFTLLATKILTSVNATSSVAVIGMSDEFPAAIEGIVMTTFPLAVAILTPAGVVVIVAEDVVVAAVVVVVVVAAAGTVTELENAFELSPTDNVTEPELEPVVTVHVNAVVLLAPTVIVDDVESPLAEYPDGNDNEYEVVIALDCEFCMLTVKENVSPDALTLLEDGVPVTDNEVGSTKTIVASPDTPPD